MNYTMTANEAVAAWDANQSLWSIECGGLGPGYEQCIQIMAIEILREALNVEDATDKPLDEKVFQELVDVTIRKHRETLCGPSGAQVGAATNIAFRAYTVGWGAMLKTAKDQPGFDQDRFIQVSNKWPHVKKGAK